MLDSGDLRGEPFPVDPSGLGSSGQPADVPDDGAVRRDSAEYEELDLDVGAAEVVDLESSVTPAGSGANSEPPPPPSLRTSVEQAPAFDDVQEQGAADVDVLLDLANELDEVPATPPPVPPPAAAGAASVESMDSPEPLPISPERPRARQWWEDFFDEEYLRSVRAPTSEQTGRSCDFIEKCLGLQVGSTVLDVGCGRGTHVVELSRRGYLGVGLDLSLAMLSKAADEAQRKSQDLNFLHADMREIKFEGTFDAVMCLGTTFGYFEEEANRAVVSRLHRALKPGGVLLMEVVNRDHVIATQPNLVWFEGDGCVCMEETTFNYFTSRLHVKRTVILDEGKQTEHEYSLRLYSLHELGQLLHQSGFRVTEVSGLQSVPGVFFGANSPGITIVAERRRGP